MERQVLEKVEKYINPLCEKYRGVIKSVYLAGSVTRKDFVSTSDIDILVIVDDTKEKFDPRIIKLIDIKLQEISKNAMKNDRLDFHIQSPKPLSVFWDMVRSGQPWIITQMRDAIVIYDPGGYIKPIQMLLNRGKLSGTKERAQMLINYAPKKLNQARKIFLEEVTTDILLAMVESAQAVLMFAGIAPPASKNIGKEISLRFVKTDIIKAKIVQDYDNFYEITRKIDHGEITHVSGREIEKHISVALEFIENMEKLFNALDFMKKKKMVYSAYDTSIKACSDALEKMGRTYPEKESDMLKHFKIHFIDTGLVSKDHIETLKKIYHTKKAFDCGNVSDIAENEIYSSNIYASNLKNAIEDVELNGKKRRTRKTGKKEK